MNLLLHHLPDFDVLEAVSQEGDISWLMVTLGQPGESLIVGESVAYARHQYAIWKVTGAVHGVLPDGSVTEDPILVP